MHAARANSSRRRRRDDDEEGTASSAKKAIHSLLALERRSRSVGRSYVFVMNASPYSPSSSCALSSSSVLPVFMARSLLLSSYLPSIQITLFITREILVFFFSVGVAHFDFLLDKASSIER